MTAHAAGPGHICGIVRLGRRSRQQRRSPRALPPPGSGSLSIGSLKRSCPSGGNPGNRLPKDATVVIV
jgi:hypothetical protein